MANDELRRSRNIIRISLLVRKSILFGTFWVLVAKNCLLGTDTTSRLSANEISSTRSLRIREQQTRRHREAWWRKWVDQSKFGRWSV
jgi:hypothetical protein